MATCGVRLYALKRCQQHAGLCAVPSCVHTADRTEPLGSPVLCMEAIRALSAGSAAVRRCNANPYRVEANRSRPRSGLGDHAVSQEPKQAAHRDVRDELFALELGARGRRGVFSAEPLRDGLAWIWSKVVILGAFGGYRLEQVRQLLGSSWDPGVAGPSPGLGAVAELP